MITHWFSRAAALAILVFGLAGCVAYQPAPYYAPAYGYAPPYGYAYGPAYPSSSLNFEFRGGGDREEHHHWR
jgi:hypothetical protein